MIFEMDDALFEAAKKKAPESYLKFEIMFHPTCGNEWKITSCRPEPHGYGETINEALQRFIDFSFAKQVKSDMEQFWANNYSRDKFEALQKFMEEYSG